MLVNKTPASHRQGQPRGFTLIEMMVVIAVMGILLSLGLPALSNFVRSQQIKGVSFELVGDLMLARSEAIKRSADVALTWRVQSDFRGWRVSAADPSGSGSLTLLQERAMPAAVMLTGSSGTTVTFDRNGRIVSPGNIAIEDVVEARVKRCIVIEPSGMPRSLIGACL